jgi:hypothetical protein
MNRLSLHARARGRPVRAPAVGAVAPASEQVEAGQRARVRGPAQAPAVGAVAPAVGAGW